MQRTNYTTGFKLKVVAFAKTSGNRSAGRECGISEYDTK